MSVLLEGETKIQDETASWSGMWQFAKDKKAGVSFDYQWVSCTLPRDLLDYVSFVPSANDPTPTATNTCGRGRGRGRGRTSSTGRGIGRGIGRGGRLSPVALHTLDGDEEILAIEQTLLTENINSSSVEIETNQEKELAEKDLPLETDKHDTETDVIIELKDASSELEHEDIGLAADVKPSSPFANTEIEADVITNDATGSDTASAFDELVTSSANPVVLDRSHPLFGLWNGSFDVRGPNGALDKVEECFFFHSFMNQDPGEDLLDLPQEPQVGYKGPPIETTAVSQLIKDEESCPTGVEGAVIGLGNAETEVDAVDGLTSKGVAGGEAAMTSEDIGESESGCAAVTAADVHDSTHPLSQAVVGEPFHKYLVGFGRNPFGRFSLTAALNEKTGRMRCEKKYITSKGSGRRGRRPGTTFSGPSANRLSIESAISEGTIGAEGASSVRAMSTRPRKSLPDSSFFFPSSYDEAQLLMASAPSSRKRKPTGMDDAEIGVKSSKEKLGGAHQKSGLGLGAAAPTSAFQIQREKEREKDRERMREKERDQELERELDDSNSDYRVAFLDDETGEIYEGGWHPHARRRHGTGVCMYSDGSMYEGGWAMGREHGKGQFMTGDRQIIYSGEWVDGMMTGQGAYTFSNGDRYSGDWREGIRHGKGEYVMSSGCSYLGDWKNNKRTGSGVFHWADGSTYDGDWENDNRHGRGVLALANGFRYDGGWFQNYMEGRGVSVFPGGQEYQGSYKAGLREGRGSIKFAHGAVYEGRFRDDRIDGQGTIVVTETMPGAEEGEILIPIQIQADIRRIHLKAGFGADAAH